MRIDQHDGDPDRFIRYMIAGVRRDSPEFGFNIESLIFSPTLPPPHYLADSLVSDLTALKIPLVIVPDDFHTIASEPVQAILIPMIQYLPDNLHLVISTRVDPPLRLAQWRVRNWLSKATDPSSTKPSSSRTAGSSLPLGLLRRSGPLLRRMKRVGVWVAVVT